MLDHDAKECREALYFVPPRSSGGLHSEKQYDAPKVKEKHNVKYQKDLSLSRPSFRSTETMTLGIQEMKEKLGT